jgi:hypothetical protein
MTHSIKFTGQVLALVASLLPCTMALASSYNEATFGDLSDEHASPTPWTLSAGTPSPGSSTFDNWLTGRLSNPDAGLIDRDYVVITVPKGTAWSGLVVGPRTQGGGQPLGQAFIAVSRGNNMPSPDELERNFTSAGLDGFSTYGGPNDFGTDILPRIGNPQSHPYYALFPGAPGFKVPLLAGDYTVWLQERAQPGTFPYAFNFVLTAVPELPSAVLAMVGLAGLTGAVAIRKRLPIGRAASLDQ